MSLLARLLVSNPIASWFRDSENILTGGAEILPDDLPDEALYLTSGPRKATFLRRFPTAERRTTEKSTRSPNFVANALG